jgi:hypothetical protein
MTQQDSNFSVLDHILSSISRPRPGDSKEPTQWPSEATAAVVLNGKEQIVGQCRRQAFFRLLEENYRFNPEKFALSEELVTSLKANKIPVSNYMRFIWAMGELYEQYIIDQAKNSGIFVYTQVPVYIKSVNVSGKEDIVIIDPETTKLSIVEVKSVYSYGADKVIGSDAERRKGQLGTPRDKNLMQIALYHWWVASQDIAYGPSRLIYGDRGAGKYAEYLVKTTTDNNGLINIWYRGITPNQTEWTCSKITINSILEQYIIIADYVSNQKIPPRDYKLQYSREDFERPEIQEELNKSDRGQLDKIKEREQENIERIENGQNPKVELKLPAKGDFNCGWCPYRNVCYSSDGNPTEI